MFSIGDGDGGDDEEKLKVDRIREVFQGDFAGLSAMFSATTGELIPVPAQLVPESMIEWGQIPSCLEVIVSEGDGGSSNDKKASDDELSPDAMLSTFLSMTSGVPQIERQVVTVLPEAGCGIDNLETVKRSETILAENILVDDACVSVDYTLLTGAGSSSSSSTSRTRVETIFELGDDKETDEETGEAKSYPMRLRVLVDVRFSSKRGYELESPVGVVLERRTSTVSSKGTIADGGGLDGRTVSRLMGKNLNVDKSFANEEPVCPTKDTDDKGRTVLCLPGGLSITHGARIALPWILEVALEGEVSVQTVVKRYSMDGALRGSVGTVFPADEDDDDDDSDDEYTDYVSEDEMSGPVMNDDDLKERLQDAKAIVDKWQGVVPEMAAMKIDESTIMQGADDETNS